MKVKSVVSALFVLGAILSSQAASPYENERQEVKRLLREDFEALNRGDKTLVEVGEHALALTESSMSVMQRRILLDGTVRLFTAAGETNRASKVRLRMETAADTYAVLGAVVRVADRL